MSDLELDIEILFSKADFNSHIEKGTIEMNNEYFNLLQEKMARIINENQELKNQLENCYCNRTDCSSRIKDSKKYDSLVQKVEKQQKEFIEWLEIYIEDRDKTRKLHKEYSLSEEKLSSQYFILQQVLSKYKEIIGGKDEN